MPAHRKININSFRYIKTLLNGGGSVKEAAECLNVSVNTVYRVKSCGSYEEYLSVMAEKSLSAAKKSNTAVEAEKQPKQADATVVDKVYGANRICELLTHQNELLKGIMNKIAFIVDELTGIPSPKDGDQQ